MAAEITPDRVERFVRDFPRNTEPVIVDARGLFDIALKAHDEGYMELLDVYCRFKLTDKGRALRETEDPLGLT